jgi:plastocyanin
MPNHLAKRIDAVNRFFIMTCALWIGSGSSGLALDTSLPTQILMENGSPYYVPATASAVSGTPIRWENPTPTHHTVTHNDCVKDDSPCLFDSGTVPPGGHFTVPGLPAGRYSYQCRIHPIMRGQLTVTDSPSVASQL